MKYSKEMGSAPGKSHVKKGNPKGTVSKYCYKYMKVMSAGKNSKKSY